MEEHFHQLSNARAELDAQVVSYVELSKENAILKTDLRNLFLEVRKLRLDHEQGSQHRATLDERVQEIGSRYLKDNVKWIANSLNANNFANCKQKLQAVIDRCRNAGLPVSPAEEASLLADLKAEYERVVRAAYEREEQSRIKAQIRDEQLREKEIERELKKLDHEREAITVALNKALAEAHDEHTAEVEQLMARLVEAEARSQRVISQAQLTKSGYVYVISNIGSFGDGVYKVGMTRRLEPMDRVRELGGASVPFPFDVHMMISCDDAPALENALHRQLHRRRLNKANPRKEFFRCDIDGILETVKAHHGEVEYRVDSEALQYWQSLTMTDDDLEYIEAVFDELEDEDAV